MTMTDPVADMLTRLRNANSAYHDTVSMPSSKLKTRVAEILKAEGYIQDWREEEAEVGKKLTIDAKSTNLPHVLGGLGIAILSTSSGLLTNQQAAKKGVGGEVLAYVW